jgi:hypothetical protein
MQVSVAVTVVRRVHSLSILCSATALVVAVAVSCQATCEGVLAAERHAIFYRFITPAATANLFAALADDPGRELLFGLHLQALLLLAPHLLRLLLERVVCVPCAAVCKPVFNADEWEQSILESHPSCDATYAALEKHRQEVAAITTALSKFQPGLGQLLSAAKTLAAAVAQETPASAAEGETSATNSSSSSDDAGESATGPSPAQLQEAVTLLQQVAAHVNWF